MNRLLQSEISKLAQSRLLGAASLLMLALAAVTSLSAWSYRGSPRAAELEIVFSGYDAFFAALRDTPTLSLLALLSIAVVVCGDFENRTAQLKIAVGYRRAPIFLSKLAALAATDALLLLPYALGRAVIQGALLGFGRPVTPEVLAAMAGTFLTAVLAGIAINAVTLVLAFALRRTVLVVGTGFCLVLLGGNALASFGASIPWAGRILAATPLGLLRAMAAASYAPSAVARAFAISAAWIAGAALAACRIFAKAELK